MNFVGIGKENAVDFESVLYPAFKPEKNRITIGAYENDGTVLGAVSMLLLDDEYDCDWLYVHPRGREMGVGTGLFDEIIRLIIDTGMIYPLSAGFEVSEEDRDLYGFFLSRDDVVVDYSHKRFYIAPEQISEAAALKKEIHTGFRAVCYSELDQGKRREILKAATGQHLYTISDIVKWNGELIPGLDMVLFDKEEVVGCIFFRKREDKYLELSYIYSGSPLGTLQLIVEAGKKVREEYPGYGIVYDAVSDEAEALSLKIFSGAVGLPVYEATWIG